MSSIDATEWTETAPSLDCLSTHVSTVECFDFAAIDFIFDGSGYKYLKRTRRQWVPDQEVLSTCYPV